ncbi:MAG: hypothetical protein SOR65_01660 [Odoribacter sp.]|nr:hypothetical protein [Odoribacter sp.]
MEKCKDNTVQNDPIIIYKKRLLAVKNMRLMSLEKIRYLQSSSLTIPLP